MTTLEFRKRLYLNKVYEVRQRVATGDLYDLIMATGLIRHLLMSDGRSLALRASRDLRHKLTFTVNKYVPFPKLDGSVWHFLPVIYELEPVEGRRVRHLTAAQVAR